MKYFIPVFIALFIPSICFGKSAPAVQWNGQYLAQSEGAVYFNIKLTKFKKSSRGKSLLNNVVVTVKNTLSQKKFALSQRASTGAQPNEIWILPSGSYEIKKVSFIDNNGVRRTWSGSTKFKVSSLNLSYLGLWTISPNKKVRLKLKIKSKKSKYKHVYEHQTFIAVIDGMSGDIQKELGGEDVVSASKTNYGTQSEARAAFTHTVNVAMFYKIDLGRNNRYASQVARTIQSQEVNFRNCYTSYLEENSDQGSVGFKFLIGKADGLMSKIKHSGGSIKDDKLVECLYYNLGLMQFPLSRNIKGKITFLFKNQ